MKHDMTMEETWKVTLEDPGIEVSNLGNVRRKDAKKRVNVAVSKHVKGYRTSRIAGKNLLLHRVVWGAFNGKIPDDKVIDHVNRDRSDNRLANLRLASSSENAHGGKAPNTVSDFRGVSFDAQSSKWSATITKDGKNIKIGLFGSEFEAAVAYDLYASDLYKGYAALNYPKLSSVFAKQTALAERRAVERVRGEVKDASFKLYNPYSRRDTNTRKELSVAWSKGVDRAKNLVLSLPSLRTEDNGKTCDHVFDTVLLSYPPQYKCSKCGFIKN